LEKRGCSVIKVHWITPSFQMSCEGDQGLEAVIQVRVFQQES